jgi:hypothetical protein
MAATIIDGKAVAAEVRGRVAEDVKAYADAHDGRVPGSPRCWWATTRPRTCM